jgi:hypothetical protein
MKGSWDRKRRLSASAGLRAAAWLLLAMGAGIALAAPPGEPIAELPIPPGDASVSLGKQATPFTIDALAAAAREPQPRAVAVFRVYADAQDNCHVPAWSHDGEALAFLITRSAMAACKVLVQHPLSASQPVQLYNDRMSQEQMVAWNCGDSRLMAFVSTNEDNKYENVHLWDGVTPPEQFTHRVGGTKVLPSLLAKDGEIRMLVRHNEEIVEVTCPEHDRSQLHEESLGIAEEATFSASGQSISMIRNAKNDAQELVLRDAQSHQERTLFNATKRRFRNLAWSPDGQWIAFFAQDKDSIQWDLCVLRAEGREAAPTTVASKVRVDEDFRNVGPTWSPDSKRLWFFSSEGNQGYYPLNWVSPADRAQGVVGYPQSLTTATDVTACPSPSHAAVAFVAVERRALNVYVLLLNHF